jgi:VanZ family protein
MALKRHRRSRLARIRDLWIAYWVLLFVATHVPIPGRGPVTVEHGDKVIHFVVYFILTWLGGRYLLATGRGTLRALAAWAAIYLLYAGADEYLQSLVGRTMSLSDWLADAAGIVLATLVLARRRPSGALSERGDVLL